MVEVLLYCKGAAAKVISFSLLLSLIMCICLPHAASNLPAHFETQSNFAGSIGSLYSIGAQPMLASCYIPASQTICFASSSKVHKVGAIAICWGLGLDVCICQ